MNNKLLKGLLLTSLVLPLLAACGGNGGVTATEEELIQANATSALGAIGITYNAFSQSAGISKDTDLTDTLVVEGYHFSFAYTVTASVTGYAKKYVSVDTSETLGTYLAIIVPENTELPAENQSFAAYSLKAVVSFTGYDEDLEAPSGVKFTTDYVGTLFGDQSWKIRVNATKTFDLSLSGVYEAYTAKTIVSGTRLITYGVFAGTDNSTYSQSGILFVDDGNYSIALYDATKSFDYSGFAIGDKVKVVGILSYYFGLLELTSYTMEKKADASVSAGVQATLTAIPNPDFNYGARSVKMTGVMTSITFTYGDSWLHGTVKANINVNLSGAKDASTGKLIEEACAYVHYADAKTAYDTWSSISATSIGSTLVFTGRYEWYSGLPELYFPVLVSCTPAA